MTTRPWFDQDGATVRFDWGLAGLRHLGPLVDAVVIVDVLSFSTAVDIATGRGATVLPCRWDGGDPEEYAASQGAVLASKDRRAIRAADASGWSLSPTSLSRIPAGTRIVLPSANGSELSFAASEIPGLVTIAGCIRNRMAIAEAAASYRSVAVIAAGERWGGRDGPLRVALEDQLGAGSIIDGLIERGLQPSVEAEAAAEGFRSACLGGLADRLRRSGSGRELVGRGWNADLDLAVELDCSVGVPTLSDGAYRTSPS